jgi:signal transduction histidine kinase
MKFRSPEIANLTYPTILQELDAAIVVLDKQFRVVGINHPGRELLKGDLGQPSNHPAGGDWEQWLQRTASSVDGSPIVEKLTVVKGSMERFFNLHVLPIHDGQQKIVAYVFVLRDITYVKCTQETLDSARNRFELLFKFIHDLRTPLNGISGLAEMLELSTLGPLNDKQKEATQRMLERCEHLTELINDFVSQGKLDYQQLEQVQKDLDQLN